MFDTLSQLASEWLLPGILFWLVMCLGATNVMEWMTNRLGSRARSLETAINHMFGDEELTQKFYNHVLMKTTMVELWKSGNKGIKQDRKPDHIDPRLFAQIILGWVTNPDPGVLPKKRPSLQTQLQANIQSLHVKYPQFAQVLKAWLLDSVEDQTNPAEFLSTFQANLEVWFDAAMQETSRQYKQYAKRLLLLIGFIMAMYLNFDPISLTYHLWNASQSQKVTAENTENGTSAEIPIGWTITDDQDGKCSLFPGEGQFFGIRFINNGCISQSPSSQYDNIFLKLMGFLLGSVLISIGSQYIYDRWKDKITI